MFLNILLLSAVLLSISMLGMALSILVKKKGKFPAYQIGHNKDMSKMGVKCVTHTERNEHRKRRKASGCDGCQQISC